ncbi:cytochrome ubiquinol oxidase subunit I [Chromobacterium sp. ASV23]|uniref:cytochrome ubiquinol oxidase subunit I n=1 Tax=Chromobacterium sp. ASV23 TaxID=2795110 RepID=UPI0018EC3348|nr:cytochrome ubiquinol oxidase subunit I [Chromobacterium sp. ASV23]
MNETLIDLSRLQFAVTALYHFLFVPLTLGMVWMLVIMESTFVITGKEIYRDMTRFWGKLFGINFALGVTTGITMEFQFGTNWAYYSHYVGDIFGAPLAIEGLMAFFLESTFIGLFFFGWDRLSRAKHLMVTILMAIGSNLSALWILIANGWMQNPVGAHFNYQTMRMEMSSMWDIMFNPVAQAKFVHTVSAGYVTAACFVLGISSWYILKGRDLPFARRSFRIAAAFGFASALSVIVLGDESGYTVAESQHAKIATIEGIWHTEDAPAGLTLFGIPDKQAQTNHYEIKIPYLLGLIGTRSVDKPIPGISEIIARNRARIVNGREAVIALEALRKSPQDPALRAAFEKHEADLGFGLLLKKYVADVRQATPAMIDQAAQSTIPEVAPMFWSFRVMVGLGFSFLALFTLAFWFSLKNSFAERRWLLKWALWWIPMPWIAAELGWVVAEYGRQPWTVYGLLPTHLSTSSLTAASVAASLTGFVLFYTGLLVAEMYLMVKYARLGPASLGTGRYHNESAPQLAAKEA